MHYLDRHVYYYIEKKMRGLNPALASIAKYASVHHVPIINCETARFLQSQVAIKAPRTILEIGTAVGYSGALMLLDNAAYLTTIEIDSTSYQRAADNFEKLGLSPRVEQHLGDASAVLDDLIAKDKRYDLVFIDAAKGQYLDYFTKAEKLLNNQAVVIADNVLFKGIVADLPHVRRQRTIYQRLNAFIDYVNDHPAFYTSLVSVGDGMMIAVRKA